MAKVHLLTVKKKSAWYLMKNESLLKIKKKIKIQSFQGISAPQYLLGIFANIVQH